MNNLLSTKQVAKLLNINEKMVYSLIADKGLPATKITGKWLFPQYLVEQWVEVGAIIIAIGVIILIAERFNVNLFRLPGDIVWKGKNFKFYFPIVTSVLLSVLLSLILFLINRFK